MFNVPRSVRIPLTRQMPTRATLGVVQRGIDMRKNHFTEPVIHHAEVGQSDVIVCGGGPAGFAAAIAAARMGLHVRLFECRGCLGGIWTAGLLGYLLDFDKPGLAQELVAGLDAMHARRGTQPWALVYDPEAMKVLLEEFCEQAGVTVQLHTRVVAAYCAEGRLDTIITESKSGRQAWRAPVFIDASGDGDLGALAGCAWDFGNGGDGNHWQPMSLNAVLMCRDAAALDRFILPADITDGDAGKMALLAEIRRAGIEPSYRSPTLFRLHDHLLVAMLNHEYGVHPADAAAITRATMRARREMHRITAGLRALGGPWSDLQVVATAEQIGVRDGRRLAGRHRLTHVDVASGSCQPDAIVRSTLPVDIHGHDVDAPAVHQGGIQARPFDIPVRALLARDVDGLLMAGRCVSGDHVAHGSYRVTGNAVAMGEAAGTVAGLAVERRCLPHEVPWSAIAVMLDRRPPARFTPEHAPWVPRRSPGVVTGWRIPRAEER